MVHSLPLYLRYCMLFFLSHLTLKYSSLCFSLFLYISFVFISVQLRPCHCCQGLGVIELHLQPKGSRCAAEQRMKTAHIITVIVSVYLLV